MKRIILSCVLAVLALGISIFQMFYVSNSSGTLLKELEIKENVYSINKLIYLKNQWKDNTKILNVFVKHDNVEAITKNLEEMIVMLETNNYEHLQYLNSNTKEQLRVINESEKLYFENIF